MALSPDKARYFWHRHLENYDPVRAVKKWNKGYPRDRATAEEIELFLADMTNRVEAGQKDGTALYCILTGQDTLERPASKEIPANPPLLKATEKKPQLKLFARKKEK